MKLLRLFRVTLNRSQPHSLLKTNQTPLPKFPSVCFVHLPLLLFQEANSFTIKHRSSHLPSIKTTDGLSTPEDLRYNLSISYTSLNLCTDSASCTKLAFHRHCYGARLISTVPRSCHSLCSRRHHCYPWNPPIHLASPPTQCSRGKFSTLGHSPQPHQLHQSDPLATRQRARVVERSGSLRYRGQTLCRQYSSTSWCLGLHHAQAREGHGYEEHRHGSVKSSENRRSRVRDTLVLWLPNPPYADLLYRSTDPLLSLGYIRMQCRF